MLVPGSVRALLIKLAASLILLIGLCVADDFSHWSRALSWMINDRLATLAQHFIPPPPAIRDIVLVGIDSKTVTDMKEHWPYSRATFARVLTRLSLAGARAIAMDFTFFGDTTLEEDAALRRALEGRTPVVLGASLDEAGGIVFSTVSGFPTAAHAGMVNKLQDPDGVTRRALTYLVSTTPAMSQTPVFSWELRLLEAVEGFPLKSLDDRGRLLVFAASERRWEVPVEASTKTFLIRFRAHSGQFARVSFHDVFTGQFDPRLIEDKIVLIGFLSELFQDIHRTPIGWLPGVTLNANAFLTLYAHDFLTPVPALVEGLLLAFGVLGLVFLTTRLPIAHAALCLALAVFLLLGGSYALFLGGYLWNIGRSLLSFILVPSLMRWWRLRLPGKNSGLFEHHWLS